MELSDLSRLTDDQSRGHEFELRDPVHGQPIGLKLTVVGPDSNVAKKARGDLERGIASHDRRGGQVPPQERSRLVDDFLFACVVSWDVREDGQPIPFNRQNFQRLIDAGLWVRAQIDLFAGDRSPYYKAAE